MVRVSGIKKKNMMRELRSEWRVKLINRRMLKMMNRRRVKLIYRRRVRPSKKGGMVVKM